MRRVFVSVTLVVALGSACSDEADGQCHELANIATTITSTTAPADGVPEPTGGTLRDGLYVLSAVRIHAPSPPRTFRQTMRVAGEQLLFVIERPEDASQRFTTWDIEIDAAASAFDWTVSCSDGEDLGSGQTYRYSSLPGRLTFQWDDGSRIWEFDYTEPPNG